MSPRSRAAERETRAAVDGPATAPVPSFARSTTPGSTTCRAGFARSAGWTRTATTSCRRCSWSSGAGCQSFDGVNMAGWLYRITTPPGARLPPPVWVKHIFNRRRVGEPDHLAARRWRPGGGARAQGRAARAADDPGQDEGRRAAAPSCCSRSKACRARRSRASRAFPLNTVWTRLHHARREFFALAAKYQRRRQPGETAKGQRDGEDAAMSAHDE